MIDKVGKVRTWPTIKYAHCSVKELTSRNNCLDFFNADLLEFYNTDICGTGNEVSIYKTIISVSPMI